MKSKINLTELNIYYNRIKKCIDSHDLSAEDFKMYYMIFKEFVYSGLFSPEMLKEYAQSLLKFNLNSVDKDDNVKNYYFELKSFVEFIDSGSKTEKFSDLTVKKVFKIR